MKKLFIIILVLLIPAIAICGAPAHRITMMGITPSSGGGTEIPTPTAQYLFENDATDEGSSYNMTATAGFSYDASNYVEGSYAGLFDTDDYVYHADNAAFEPGSGDWSMSAIIRVGWNAPTRAIFGKVEWTTGRNGFELIFDHDDADDLKLIVHTAGSATVTIDTGWTPTLETFYLVQVAVDADAENECTIWVSSIGGTFGDAINGTQYNLDVPIPESGGNFCIGASAIGIDDWPFSGQIDDFRWFNGTALTAAQAEAIYDLY